MDAKTRENLQLQLERSRRLAMTCRYSDAARSLLAIAEENAAQLMNDDLETFTRGRSGISARQQISTQSRDISPPPQR